MEYSHNGKTEIHALVVDDDDVDRERLIRMLQRGPRSINVIEASSQAEALQIIRHAEPALDIVFLDFGLSDGDGRDLVPTIRAEVDQDCPIVAVTGNADEQIAADLIKAGMTEYLTKRALSPNGWPHRSRKGSPGASIGMTCAVPRRNSLTAACTTRSPTCPTAPCCSTGWDRPVPARGATAVPSR